MAWDVDGQQTARMREIAEMYGEITVRTVTCATHPAIVSWEFYQQSVYISAKRTAHFGRIALQQSRWKVGES